MGVLACDVSSARGHWTFARTLTTTGPPIAAQNTTLSFTGSQVKFGTPIEEDFRYEGGRFVRTCPAPFMRFGIALSKRLVVLRF